MNIPVIIGRVEIVNMIEYLGKPCKIDGSGRLYLPQKVRELLDIKKGDKDTEIYFKLENNKIVLGKALVKYEYIDELIKKKK